MNHRSSARILLKGFEGRIVDLAFDSIDGGGYLAAIDSNRSLFVFKISEEADVLR